MVEVCAVRVRVVEKREAGLVEVWGEERGEGEGVRVGEVAGKLQIRVEVTAFLQDEHSGN